jgi:hypothetical protein
MVSAGVPFALIGGMRGICGILILAATAWAGGVTVTLPGLSGKFVQLAGTPNLSGLQQSQKVPGFELWQKGNHVQYARELGSDKHFYRKISR